MSNSERFWKVLDTDRTAFHGGVGKWPLKRWFTVEGKLVPCQHGLHVCRQQDLVQWLGPTIWEVEVEGEQVAVADKVVVRRARLVKQLKTWNEKSARLFACDCAEAVLPLYEKAGTSKAPREAIAVARCFAQGKATKKELDAARAAARDAAGDAAGDAAWDAAGAAAWAAARDAAWAAARDAQTKTLFAYLYLKGLK